MELLSASAYLERTSFRDLESWHADDHAAAFACFLETAEAALSNLIPLRPAQPIFGGLAEVFHAAQTVNPANSEAARLYFETFFEPFHVKPREGQGFLTAYYEPEIRGSLSQSSAFPTPVLKRPDDLVSFHHQTPPPPLPPDLSAARQTSNGLGPYFDRASIEDGALAEKKLEILYLPDPVELFFAQVQGSARIRLPDGSSMRLTYAGRNGHPYTTIGKVVVAEGHVALADLTLERFKAWLRSNPDHARRIMRLNKSYIFFELSPCGNAEAGPIGAASVPLRAHRSIAIDRSIWCYGLPFFIRAQLPDTDGKIKDFARLMIAQDTGSAILGPARADLFFGSGDEAGREAGLIRHKGDFFVLLPRVS
jgi:membrane-bound lytic murein transglycosylase A